MANVKGEHKEEKVAFLGNHIVLKSSTETGHCCCGWSKTKICCCTCLGCVGTLVLAVTVICLMLFVFKTGNMSGEAAAWEKALAGGNRTGEGEIMNGTYTLQSYDEQYEPYLKAMGVPWYIVPLILASSEKITIMIYGQQATLHTETSFRSRDMSFKFGELFNMTLPKNMGTIWNICTKDAPNMFTCKSEEKQRGWELTSTMLFSEKGIVNERHFLNDDIKAKKYYKREEEEEAYNTEVKEEDKKKEETDIFKDDPEWEEDEW